MRLVEVELENYKQYAGTHVFRPGEKAMVAIVGQNGAGKTTLFEAIEWCLYNPSRIRNDSLTPRVQGGKPRVRVVLEDQQTGIVYEIERLLKGGSTQAEIYRQDQPESPLVQGTRQVTEYVSRELTGLSHTAFAATFFTRQKELSFFGDLGPTQRREQVGRLLGLETIRVAQRAIGEKRTRRQAEARVKREQYDEQSKGIDFPAERERLDKAIDEHVTLSDRARSEETTRKAEAAAAAKAQEAVQQRFGADAELRRQFERVTGEQRTFAEMRATAEHDLATITAAETQIGALQEQGAREPELRQVLDRHAAEKQKLDDANRLAGDLSQLHTDRQKIEASLSETERGPIAGRQDSIDWANALVAAFEGAIELVAAIDLEGLRQSFERTRGLIELQQRLATERTKLSAYDELASSLAAQVLALSAEGPPAVRLATIQAERSALRQRAASASSLATQTEQRARQLQTLERSLRASDFGEVCPTCARPFQAGEAAQTLRALAEQVGLLEQETAAQRADGVDLNARAEQLGATETTLLQDVESLQNLTGRIQNGEGVIESQRREVATFELELGRQLREQRRDAVPNQGELEQRERELQYAEAQCTRRPWLELQRDQLIASIGRQQTIEGQIAALGTIAYDIEAHRRDHAAWEAARDAAARIQELQKRVAERPAREATVVTATQELSDLASEQQLVENDLARLAYQPAELEDANRMFSAALDGERAATESAHAAERQLREARRERDDLGKLEERLQALASESVAAEAAAAELSRVYSEFARFEKFVAIAVTPVLGETASELLESVTEGKYNRLEFSEDYGIEVYDGEDDRFPLSQYSGGERDVIALCARLALSQVIGGQASTPIQFMVLDEVFGSLDIDRRRNLMEMLQRLVEENQAFQQLFVISHVDDVRAGAMFDEVWRVSETSEGVSQLEQVSVTGALEDY